MKKISFITLLLAAMTLFASNVSAQKISAELLKTLDAYPTEVEGLVRHVIFVDKKKNEDNYKVEIEIGKMAEVDCNQHRLMGKLEEKDLEGWGYTYFVYNSTGEMASTMMMCPEPAKMKFVSGEKAFVRYNSKLPIVVYAPKGFDVKYSIWTAGKSKIATMR